MPSESLILLPQTTPVGTFTGTQQKGDGFYNYGDGLHTVVFKFSNYIGTAKIQATLAVTPTSTDWFDVDNSTFTGTNITPLSGTQFVNFYGNFVWIRAAGTGTSGTISEIRYNH